jgi:hypothetical protein
MKENLKTPQGNHLLHESIIYSNILIIRTSPPLKENNPIGIYTIKLIVSRNITFNIRTCYNVHPSKDILCPSLSKILQKFIVIYTFLLNMSNLNTRTYKLCLRIIIRDLVNLVLS